MNIISQVIHVAIYEKYSMGMCVKRDRYSMRQTSQECINSGLNYWNGGILEWWNTGTETNITGIG